MPVVTQIQVRRGTAANWTSTNPTLAAGEMGFETDTLRMKIGNGSTAWTSLAYVTFQATANVATWAGTPSSANLAAAMTDETGSGSLVFGTSPTISAPSINNILIGYSTTATAAGTTTLTNSSNFLQFFTGTTTQTVVLPVASTMTLGQGFEIHNNSTGIVTVNSSGSNLVASIAGGQSALITNILTSGTTAASWDVDFNGGSTATGTGSIVYATTPTLVTPVITQGTKTPTFSANAYTLVAGDAGLLLLASNSSTAGTVNIPTNASVPFALGTQITIIQTGSGQLTVTASTPATTTILSTGATAASPKLRAQYSSLTALKTATDTWYVVGDLA